MRGKNIVQSRGPGFPGPSSPGGCGLGRRIYVFCKISQGWTTIVSFFFNSTLRTYHWVSFRCSGNICCCESTGIQCKAQSLSAWCGRWRLRRNIGVKKWQLALLILDGQLSNKKEERATYQNVVWLDVPVDESHLVHAVHSADQLGDVEPGGVIFFMGKLFFKTPKRRFWFWKYIEEDIFWTHCASSSWKIPNLMRSDIKSPPGM